MSSLFKWHNRFSENENENEAMDARIPRHLDSKTKKPRHRNSRTKNPRHRERETTKPQHCDSKAFFQRRKSHNIEIPRPKNHDIKFLWNSDPYPPDSNRRVKSVPSRHLKSFCAYFVKFEQRNFFSFFQDYGFGGSDDDDDQQLNLHYSTLHAENEDLPEVVLLSQNVELIANSNIESMSHIAENINFPCRLGEPEVAVRENENNNEGYNDDEVLNSNTTQCRGYLMFLLAFLIVVLYPSLGFDNQEYHINSFRRHFY